MGRWFDPQLGPDDKEIYGFTNCMRKALDASLDCARRLDREREREREMNQPGSWRYYESSDQNVVPGATGGRNSSGLGTLPASPCSPETGPSKPRAVNKENSRGTDLPDIWDDWIPSETPPAPHTDAQSTTRRPERDRVRSRLERDQAQLPGQCIYIYMTVVRLPGVGILVAATVASTVPKPFARQSQLTPGSSCRR